MSVIDVALEVIDDNPYNPRKHYPQAKVNEMAQSLREVGLRQVPEGRHVDGRVQLAYGHMRLRGFRYNQKMPREPEKWTTMPVEVKEISDQDMFHFAMEENLTRTDITPLEVARCIDNFFVTFPNSTETEIATKHNMTQGHVANMRRVLRLPEKILEKIDEGRINFTQGRELITLDKFENSEEMMLTAIRSIRTESRPYGNANTVEGMQKAVHDVASNHCRPIDKQFEGYRYDLLFDTRAAGCLECEKMIRTNPTKSATAHWCLDPECWEIKQQEQRDKAATMARAKMEADILRQAAESVTTEAKESISQEIPATVLGKLETYRVQNLISREWWDGEAPSVEAACHAAGWKKEDCWVRVKTKKGGWSNRAGHMPTEPPPAEHERLPGQVAAAGEADRFLEKAAAGVEARERANLERPVGELPCDTCLKGETCDRTFFHIADDDSGRLICEQWECDHVSWAVAKEPAQAGLLEQDISRRIAEAPAPAPQEIPEDILSLAREKAGTRAEVLDLNDISSGDRYWRQVKQGYAILDDELRLIDDSAECLERCTHGFHYAFDSKASEQKEIHVCSDTKCLAKKKSAFTRAKNAEGQARKKAETKAIKEAIAQTATLDRPRIKLILLAQMDGRHTQRSYYGGGDGKNPETWLWEKISAGTPAIERKREDLFNRIDKLTDDELARLVVEFMFYYLTDKGDIGNYEIKAEEPLKWMGIDIKMEAA